MNISRFFGVTSREAMRQVRLALGPDALIISNKHVSGGVEILATDPNSADSIDPGMHVSVAPGQALHAAASSMPNDVMQAIGSLKGVLEGRIDELLWGNHLKQVPQAVALFQTLMGFGFSTALLHAMLKRLPENLTGASAFQWARQELIQHLPVLSSEDEVWQPGLVLAVVGPTGVGKTTTLAKLAARAVRRFGPRRVVLITTDTYRIGAHEQLKIYGHILKVPVHVVQDAGQLATVVRGTDPESVILIDNVGISQRDHYVAEQAAMLASAGRTVQRLLVLNAASHGDTLDEVARAYRNDGGLALAGCVITKLDEATRLGSVLDTCIRYRLPVHYVSDGQKVPENLHLVSAAELVDKALAEISTRLLYTPTEADLAALMHVQTTESAGADRQAELERQRFLSGVFSGSLGIEKAVHKEALLRLCDYLDTQPACKQAFALWRKFCSGSQLGQKGSTLAHQACQTLQQELRQSGLASDGMVLSHVGFGRAGKSEGRVRLGLAYHLSAGMLGSVLQQLQHPGGWQSSNGCAGINALSAAQALLDDLAWYQSQQGGFPVLHLFDGGTQRLWHQLQENTALLWGAQCTPRTRFLHEETLTTAGALSKACHYQSVDIQDMCFLDPDASRAQHVWLGTQEVSLPSSRASTQGLRLLHIRAQPDGTNATGSHQVAVLAPESVDANYVAKAVWLRQEQYQVLRAVQSFMDVFARMQPESTLLDRVHLSAMMGAATWQLVHGGEAISMRQTVLSNRRRATTGQLADAVLRIFSAKALMAPPSTVSD